MDIGSIVSPVIQDRELLEEFADALGERAIEIERDVGLLKKTPTDRELIATLFRAVHNIKGDASLCRFELGIALAHPFETLLARFRSGEIVFSELVAESLLLTIDRLELATDALLAGRALDQLGLAPLLQGLQGLADASSGDIDAQSARLIQDVTGFPPVMGEISVLPPKTESAGQERKSASMDLQFFRSLAQQLESRSPLFKGRTMRILRLALETNRVGGNKVDPLQLEAAVYLHDIGMMFLPEATWLKVGQLNPADRLAMRNHPGFAAGLLQRMPGWEGAAEIISQHHEMPDGAGYPLGLGDEAISDGAKILAIVDAFEAVMLKHIHRGKNRSVLRAIAEINACNNQFSKDWIGPFNAVIRRTVES